METVSSNVEYFSSKKRRRTEYDSSSDDGSTIAEGKEPLPKKWFYVLASEDTEESEGEETIYSLQDKTTDFVQDTSDVLSESLMVNRMVEFEVDSESDQALIIRSFVTDSSSESENQALSHNSEEGKEIVILPHSGNCWHCSQPKNNPLFTCCDSCFRAKKRFFPPRPQRKKSKKGKTSPCDSLSICSEVTGTSHSSDSIQGSSQGSLPVLEEATLSSQENAVDISLLGKCQVCFNRPRNGGFLHSTFTHVYACFICSKKIWKQSGRCPICNYQAYKIIRVIV